MREFNWLEDRVETLSGGAYKFGSVGELEIGRIREELLLRGQAAAILDEAKLAFSEGRTEYEGAALRLLGLLRARSEMREMLEEVYGWIDTCFEGRAPVAELPENLKLKFAVEAVKALEGWQQRSKAPVKVAEVLRPQPVGAEA